MYIFRQQRLKLEVVYRDLYDAHKNVKVFGSPPNPTPPVASPANPSESPSSTITSALSTSANPPGSAVTEEIVNTSSYGYFMKEMASFFRALELWNRYERTDDSALGDITDLYTVEVETVIAEMQKVVRRHDPQP